MSSEATRFVTKECRDVPKELRYTLLVAATYADEAGKGIRASASTLAEDTGKSPRQIKRDLSDLRKLGKLTEGDQALVAHLRPEHRPVVYDIAPMAVLASVTPLRGRKAKSGGAGACEKHAGQKAGSCGPCRSERIERTS